MAWSNQKENDVYNIIDIFISFLSGTKIINPCAFLNHDLTSHHAALGVNFSTDLNRDRNLAQATSQISVAVSHSLMVLAGTTR